MPQRRRARENCSYLVPSSCDFFTFTVLPKVRVSPEIRFFFIFQAGPTHGMLMKKGLRKKRLYVYTRTVFWTF